MKRERWRERQRQKRRGAMKLGRTKKNSRVRTLMSE